MYKPTFKYLSGEGKRNRHNADLYEALLCVAWGIGCSVMTGHHIAFLFNGDLMTEDEIPSADTLLFDLEIMGAVFGAERDSLLQTLALQGRNERENTVRARFCSLYPHIKLAPEAMTYSAAAA
jgi:hypothetical protein